MATRCTVCAHPQAEEISMEILQGTTLRAIADKYGLSLTSVHRHKQHIPRQLAVSHEAQKVAKADGVMLRMAELDQRADTIYRQAAEQNDPELALKALKELRGITELYAKMAGEISTKTVNNFIVTPEWASLRGVLLRALSPYPDARKAVVEALEGSNVI